MKRKILAVTAVCAVSFLLSSCDSQNKSLTLSTPHSTEISFSWWGNDSRHDYTIPAVDHFEDLNDSIHVSCHYSEWSGYQTRNDVQMVSNSESDVMQINYSWLNQYSHDGDGYYDLSTLSDIIDFSNYTEEELEYGMQNGKLNAIPIALNTMTVYVNKTVYSKYHLDTPKTFDDLFNAAKVMKGEHYPIALSQKPAWFLVVSYAGQKTGKDFMDNDGRIKFTKDDIRIMLEIYCDMVNNKVMPSVDDFDKRDFFSGKYASTMVWLSDANNYCSPAEENGFVMEVGDYLTINKKLDNWYVKPATLYAIRKNTEHPNEAAKLLDYLVNSEDMALMQKTEKGIPLSRSARNFLIENNELNGIQTDAFNMMSDHQTEFETISPFFETDILYKSFSAACTEVLFEKSSIDEQAQLLYDIFQNYQDNN